MQMIEANHTQLTALPLPAAALVIDTRGAENDDIMDRLRIEIADLTNDMKTQEVHHWRYLSDFLSFWVYEPMTSDEVDVLRRQKQNAADAPAQENGHTHTEETALSEKTALVANGQAVSGLTGKIDPSMQKGFYSPFFFQQDDDIAPIAEDRSTDLLQQNIHIIAQEVDRLRNNRIVAVTDLDKSMSGRSTKDATVRVYLLTDVERPDSLATAAVYAATLKQYYEPYESKERPNQQPMINTIAVCLNNSSGAAPSTNLKELLWNDCWDHLDALILTEDYRQDAASIAGDIQTYLAELLLYMLMIIPPLRTEATPKASAARGTTTNSTPPPKTDQAQKGQSVDFPPSTFLIGMAAMEHSARWGRRLLNYSIVEQSIKTIQKGTEEERARAKNIVITWLDSWRKQVRSAIPDKVPGDIATLQAINKAKNAIKPTQNIFTTNRFSPTIGKTTMRDLQVYLGSMLQTYTLSQAAPEARPTLQEAADSIPQIQLHLREWESKSPALRKGTPLVEAQVEAQRILSHRDFFTGASGAIYRARLQLEELSTAITNFRGEHQRKHLDLEDRRKQLETSGKNQIENLQEHLKQIPFLSLVLELKQTMALGTLVVTILIGLVAVFLGVAWLHHLVTYYNGPALPLPDLTPYLNGLFLLSVSPVVSLLFWIVILVIVIGVAVALGRRFLDENRSALKVEVTFLLALIVFALFSFGTSVSIVGLAGDHVSDEIIGWLSFLPILGTVAFILFVAILAAEIWYLIKWFNQLLDERVSIVNKLNEEHQKNIEDVIEHIADTIALHLLKHTGLTGDKGGPGEYYSRIIQLNSRLKEILEDARKQQKLARKRLAMSVSETQLGAGIGSQDKWLNLHIRDELLDVSTLADSYNRLMGRLDQEIGELKEFCELLLRVMGEEIPTEIEQQFRDRTTYQGAVEEHNAQVLMSTLVAMALRLSINATLISSLNPLIQQYDAIAESFEYEPMAMKSLIENLRKKVRQNLLQPLMEGNIQSGGAEANTLAGTAIAAWGQMLWERKDAELDRTLSTAGVLPKLLEKEHNPHMIKRLLGLRTSLFGRNTSPEHIGMLYLLLPPSSQTHQFSQELNLSRRYIIDFPDVERLLLLYIQHYVGKALVISTSAPLQVETGSNTAITKGEAVTGQTNMTAQNEPNGKTVDADPVHAEAGNGNGTAAPATGQVDLADTNEPTNTQATAQPTASTSSSINTNQPSSTSTGDI